MDFSYIKSASSCPPSCAASGGEGPTQGDPGLPPIEGNQGIPQPPGDPTVPGNPPVTGIGDDGTGDDAPTPGKEINCVGMRIIPDEAEIKIGELLPFTLEITYSNGQKGYPVRNTIWSTSDEDVAIFDQPTEAHFRTGTAANDPLLVPGIVNDPLAIDKGFYVRGVAAGEVTVLVTYSAPSTKDHLVTNSTANWYGACNATLSATLTVTAEEVADPCAKELTFFDLTKILRLEVAGGDGLHEGGFAQVGQPDWPFTAKLIFTDGHVEDVSQFVVWSSSETSVATIDCFGKAHPVGEGTTSILAEIQGMNGQSTLEVVGPAAITIFGTPGANRPIDAILVMDRSASMMLRDEQGLTRVDRAITAAKMFLNNSDQEDSQVGLVTFAGVWIEGATPGTELTEADATLDLTLTTDKRSIRTALNEFKVRGSCPLLEGVGTRCATGIGSGLEVAFAELLSDRHQYGNKRIIVLISDGIENINKPEPLALAAEIKAESIGIAVIALDVTTGVGMLQTIASPSLFFSSPSVFELSYEVAQIPFYVTYYELPIYAWYT